MASSRWRRPYASMYTPAAGSRLSNGIIAPRQELALPHLPLRLLHLRHDDSVQPIVVEPGETRQRPIPGNSC